MATHLKNLSWRIPMDRAPGRLYSPCGHKELDMTEVISTHVGEENLKVLTKKILKGIYVR